MPFPSVLLHEHLDGGLRVPTILELAASMRLDLPAGDQEALAAWFYQGESGSLERYLEAFEYTIGVMQTAEALRRVAFESLEDLAAQGVTYAEVRFAPMLNLAGGLDGESVVEAVIDGFEKAAAETGVQWGLILDAMRDQTDSELVAELCASYSDAGVVGFDLAGKELGHPPDHHLPAIRRVREAGLNLTIHAGEAAGVESIRRALHTCGTDRIGHGVEIIEDCTVIDGEITEMGPLASEIRDREVVLEICPTSNLHTKGWTPAQHPVGALYRAGFNITLNTDNRLMSSTSVPAEFRLLADFHGWTGTDFAKVTRAALVGAFCAEEVKQRLWEEQIAPGYADLGVSVTETW